MALQHFNTQMTIVFMIIYLLLKFGLRFSTKAATPSGKSCSSTNGVEPSHKSGALLTHSATDNLMAFNEAGDCDEINSAHSIAVRSNSSAGTRRFNIPFSYASSAPNILPV